MSTETLELEHVGKRKANEPHGHDFEIEIDWNIWRENYGADADGNRGEMRTEVEPEACRVALVKTIKGKQKARVIDYEKISDDAIRKAIQKAIDDAEPADADYGESEPPERDDDD